MLLLLHLICQKLLKTRPRQSRRSDSQWLADDPPLPLHWKSVYWVAQKKIDAENYFNSSICVYRERHAICVRQRTRRHKGLCLLLHLGHFVPAECATLGGHPFHRSQFTALSASRSPRRTLRTMQVSALCSDEDQRGSVFYSPASAAALLMSHGARLKRGRVEALARFLLLPAIILLFFVSFIWWKKSRRWIQPQRI